MTRIPIFVAQAIADLPGKFLWLGGGDTDIKLRIALDELQKKSEVPVIIDDISNPKTC
jgi:hypothetical protein